jgi:hypothetical protein
VGAQVTKIPGHRVGLMSSPMVHEIGVMWVQAKDPQEPPKAEEARRGLS